MQKSTFCIFGQCVIQTDQTRSSSEMFHFISYFFNVPNMSEFINTVINTMWPFDKVSSCALYVMACKHAVKVFCQFQFTPYPTVTRRSLSWTDQNYMDLEHTSLIFIRPASIYCFLLEVEEDKMAPNLTWFVKRYFVDDLKQNAWLYFRNSSVTI